MCRPTVQDHTDAQVLERLQHRLHQLGCGAPPPDHVASRGSGPRLFCGHVPPECTEELVKAHFSQWGHVMDVYFPKRKDTFRRRPFCFVTFNCLEDAQRALAESPMNICGIPIKQLNLVEDRADYYKHRHTAAQSALVQALQTLALLGDGAAAAPGSQPPLAPTPAVDLNNLAALLSLEGGAAQMQAPRPQPYPMHQASHSNYDPRFAPGPASLPFANLPGFTSASLTTGAASLAMAPAASPAAYMPAPVPQPAFPPASAAALAAALATPAPGCADWQLPAGASSPYSTLDAAHASASSSPPKSGELAQLAAAVQVRAAGGSASSGSTSPDLGAAAANRLAMWQLQNELLAGEGASALAPCCDWAPGALAATSNS